MWSKRQCNNKHERGRKREEIKIAAYERTWKNIAKGTTDPRVEFILPKSYRKFKHKS